MKVFSECRYVLVVSGSDLRRITTLLNPFPEHLVRANRRVSRWQAYPKSRGLFPMPAFPSFGCERKGKKKGRREETASRVAKNRNEARLGGKAMRRRRRWLWQPSSSWLLYSFSSVIAKIKQKPRANKGSRSKENEKRRAIEE